MEYVVSLLIALGVISAEDDFIPQHKSQYQEEVQQHRQEIADEQFERTIVKLDDTAS